MYYGIEKHSGQRSLLISFSPSLNPATVNVDATLI